MYFLFNIFPHFSTNPQYVNRWQEKLVGWKTISEGSEHFGEKRIRVPVFEPVTLVARAGGSQNSRGTLKRECRGYVGFRVNIRV